MINKNSSGTSLSANYDTAVATTPRQWQVQFYVNGTLLSCGIKSMTITKGSCGSTESFAVGNVYSSMMTAELLELNTDIKGEDIEVRIGLDTGSVEWITAGWFTAIEVIKTVYSTSVTAYGFASSKTAGAFTVPGTLSLANIATAIQTATGKTVTFDTGINTGYVLAGTIDDGSSCYQGLQILAHAVGGYAVDTYDGNFAIHKFSNTSTVSVATDRMKSLPNVEEQAFSITGVQVKATGQYTYSLTTDVAIDPSKTYYTYDSVNQVYVAVEEPDVADIGTYYERFDVVYTYGSPVVLYDENPNMSADVFDIYKGIVGYAYRTGTIDLSMGDARIEGNDVLTVTDVNSDTYTVPCHVVKHTYDGGLASTIQAVKATADGDGLVSNAPITQQIDQISSATAIAKASAENAMQYAEQAQQSATTASQQAQQAIDMTSEIRQLAQQASDNASIAQQSASSATMSANIALDQLGIVENVVGVLELISKHGTYELTQDTSVVPDKWYFVRSGTAPDYVYEVVQSPTGDPNAQGWYELTGIDQAIQNYVSSQLVVDNDGLWLKTAGMQTKVQLSATEGVVLYGTDGSKIGKYGSTALIGDERYFHIEIDGSEIGFYDGANKVAYVSNQQLYITQSVVLQQMDLGTPQINGGLGQWSWKVHPNANGYNNLNLKWIG